MKIAVMQPYFLPYIGYWQLFNVVDKYVIYDNIKFTKKGWINRNRYLLNGKDALFSIPLKKDSDFVDIRERVIADTFEKIKLVNQLKNAYQKAPFFNDSFPIVEKIINNNCQNLFDYLLESIKEVCSYLNIDHSKIIVSSTIQIDHSLKSEDKVLAICSKLGATEYFNAIGGIELYNRGRFASKNIELKFVKTNPIEYNQLSDEFVPWLSVIDVMMFNSKDVLQDMLHNYSLV